MQKSTVSALVVGAVLIVGAVLLALWKDVPKDEGLGGTRLGGAGGTVIVPDKNAPVIVRFVGDLAEPGQKQSDGTFLPYVIGDAIDLQAEVLNAVEYRWTVNGEPLLDDQKREWSPVLKRTYDFNKAGELKFVLEARAKNSISQPKESVARIVPLMIEAFEPDLAEDGDRVVTGGEYSMHVHMVEPLTADPDFYRYRYIVNDVPIKHPDDDEEWTTETTLQYVFEKPGRYAFKVEVRRATEPEAETSASLPETLTVADSVVDSFDTNPEKYCKLGTSVHLNAWLSWKSDTEKAECRFGYKKVVAPDFEWISDATGAVWDTFADRNWLPKEAGNYILRVEVREKGKTEAEDFREVLFTVTEGDF